MDPVRDISAAVVTSSDLIVINAQNVPNWDHDTIVGTSQDVLRPYFRLTSVRKLFRWSDTISRITVGSPPRQRSSASRAA